MNAAPRLVLPALAALALFFNAPAPAAAATDNFCDFTSTSGMKLNGNAYHPLASGTIRLTQNFLQQQRGSAFISAPVPIAPATSFHAFFRFRIGPNTGGGDGMVFVLQATGNGALGNAGGDLGYGGIGQSIGIELDTFQNNGWDANGNHIALLADGDTHTHLATASPVFTLANNQTTSAWIDYDGVAKQIQVFVAQSGSKPATPTLTASVDLAAHVGTQAWVGVTAATGGNTNNHDLYELEFSTDGYPCCASAPAGACPPPGIACGSGGLCAECTTNADCSAPKPKCDTSNNTCVVCLKSSDCSGATPVCETGTHTCQPCANDGDCAATPATPKCAVSGPSQGACVACTSDAACAQPKPTCDLGTNTCGCTADAACGAGAVCDTMMPGGQCVMGCHVVGGVDSCAPGLACDKQDGTIGVCQTVGTTSSSSGTGGTGGAGGAMSSSSSSSGAGGAGGSLSSSSGAGGAGGSSSSSSSGSSSSSSTSGSSSGAGGSSSSSSSASSGAGGGGGTGGAPADNGGIVPLGGGCWCGIGGESGIDPRSIAVAALLGAALVARRRRR